MWRYSCREGKVTDWANQGNSDAFRRTPWYCPKATGKRCKKVRGIQITKQGGNSSCSKGISRWTPWSYEWAKTWCKIMFRLNMDYYSMCGF